MKSDTSMLKSMSNAYQSRPYVITHYIPEVTFEGDDKKPDFGKMTITFIPNLKIIELKSLKIYFYQFRNQRYSYERFINVVFNDISDIYEPVYLKVELETNPRGGISSKLKIEL